jgi:peptidoglycan/LPS O-acetylase OafA/YrhL
MTTAKHETTAGQRGDAFPALTGIRFPLAIWVVLYHIGGQGQMWEALADVPVVHTILVHAYTALGTFFAISGFVLTRAYAATDWNSRSLKRYFIARFARIYPLYFFSLLLISPIILAQVRGPAMGSIGERAGILVNYLLLLQGWHRPPVDWNTPAWSLSCEVAFYAAFALVAWLLRGRRGRTVLLGGLTFGIPVLVHLLPLPHEWKPLGYVGDFLAGMFASDVYDVIVEKFPEASGKGDIIYLPAIAAGILVVLREDLIQPWIVFDDAIRFVNGAVVLGLALGGGILWRVLSNALVTAAGSASYAIYILHVPVLWWFKRSRVYAELPPLAAGTLFLLGVFAFSMIVSRFLEEPANAVVRRKLLAIFLRRAPRKGVGANIRAGATGELKYEPGPVVS